MASPSCLLTVLGLTVLAALRADSLPITSRPIEGPIQRMVWEDWVNLGPEEQALVAHKKVTAKSIFTLPFRHCPPHHTLYNELCIPQSNINPNQLIVQELILAETGNGKPPPAPIADYDYGNEPEESDEVAFDIGGIPPPAMSPSSGQDQALPSEDAPLKFNIFEKKFPTGTGEPDTDLLGAIPPPAVPPAPKASNATTTTTPPPPGDGPMDGNRIANGDLQASSSNALATTATLTLPSSTTTSTTTSSTTSRIDIGNVEAIVLPADGSSVQLVTGSLTDDDDDDSGDEADAKASATHNPNAEADLAQLLKDDAFVPAYEGSIEVLQPPFSHRRVSPPLSAVLDVKTTTTQLEDDMEIEGSSEESDETTTTDIVPVSGEEEVDEASTTIATDDGDDDDDETTDIVESSLTPTTMDPETTSSSSLSSSTLLVPDLDEGKNGLVLIKSKVQPVQVTTTTTTTASTSASVTDAYTSSTSDRFHYQHFEDVAATSSTTSATSTPAESTSSSNSIRNASQLLEESDNLMTNTIGEEDGHKTTSEINVQQELKLINELVKNKRLSQMRKQQDQVATSTEATSSSQAWSKIMPELATSSTTETALPESTTTTSQTATTTLSINNRSNRNSKIIRVETSPTATATATSTKATLTSNTSDGYTPFWWLPNIGWRLDRQVDGNGEDRSLLLRFFSTFRGSDRTPMR
ncbi:hypothetical protein KR026_001048 [Drosophila bipectinata]|nr:hypothetical protein KR026_001048 [Drosophila bipectinata]